MHLRPKAPALQGIVARHSYSAELAPGLPLLVIKDFKKLIRSFDFIVFHMALAESYMLLQSPKQTQRERRLVGGTLFPESRVAMKKAGLILFRLRQLCVIDSGMISPSLVPCHREMFNAAIGSAVISSFCQALPANCLKNTCS